MLSTDMVALVNDYLERMRQGAFEEGFFGLIDVPAALPLLMKAFHADENVAIRGEIVECIWQAREPESVEFLAELLWDREPAIWKQALDGIVAIAGNESVQALESALERAPEVAANGMIDRAWIREAIEQLKENGEL